jgi:hypothetical protein
MRHRPRYLFAAVVLITAVILATSAQAAAPPPPPTLDGEQFIDLAPTVTGTCNPNGTSTIYFDAAGAATGPYNGTFTETGTATIGPQAFTDPPINSSLTGPVVTFDAIFTITSGTTQITGTKTLSLVNGSQAIGDCFTLGPAHALEVILLDAVSYQAAIATGDATYSDHGRNPDDFVQHVENPAPTIVLQYFQQDFKSDLSVTEPLNTPGHATGGGQVPADASFGFEAKSGANGMKGNCTVIDRSGGVKVKCLDVTSYLQTGTHATFSGHATVNGVATTYRIDVDDAGEPGAGQDTFKIVAGTYSAGGTLTEGNVQIHSG